jgi:hypothetical protein
MQCQKGKCGSVPFSFGPAPALKPVARAGDKFSPSRLCRLDLKYHPDTDAHPRIGCTHDDKSLQRLLVRDPVADE